jgi:inorganic triphosphatase YgiF
MFPFIWQLHDKIMTTEVELKLALATENIPALKRHPLLQAAGTPLRRNLRSIYHDTPKLSLMRHRAALRVRRIGRGWVQTVKIGGGANGGLHQRPEWEVTLPDATPNPALFDAPAVRALITPARQAKLLPVFETRFWRTTWQVQWGNAQIEVALDQGEVRSGAHSQPICELELELKSGPALALFDLALALAETIPLRPDPVSKAERGYALFLGQLAAPVKAAPAGLRAAMPVTAAAIAAAQSALAQLTGNLAVLQDGRDPEYLHQLRIALRRMDAALRINLHCPALAALRAELRWALAATSAARDWDVLATQTLPALQAQSADDALARLTCAIEPLRSTAHADLIAAMESARFGQFLLRAGRALLSCEQDMANAGSADTLKRRARDLLTKRQRQLLQRGEGIAVLTAAARHRLRIAAKKQRYLLAFVAEIYPQRASRAYLAALTVLQQQLGDLNDLAVAQRRLQALRPRHAWACGLVQGWCAAQTAQLLATLTSVWDGIETATSFWRGRA